MHRLISIAVLCALAAPAVADGVYFTESFGGTDVEDELTAKLDNAARIRIGIGYREGRWAVEGWLAADLGYAPPHPQGEPPRHPRPDDPDAPVRPDGIDGFDANRALLAAGVDIKRMFPISKHVEVYLRGSISRGALDSEDYSGRGLGVGAGIQLKGKVPAAGLLFWPLFFCKCGPKITGAVFLDEGFDFYRLHPGGALDATPAIDAKLTHMMIGLAAGTDF